MKIMKNNVNEESFMENITIDNDFKWFGYEWDVYENFDGSEFENMNVQKLDFEKIDEFVENLDYMWFDDYLDKLENDDKNKSLEYIKDNHSEFLKDEEWNLREPMKWNTNSNKEIFDNFGTKFSFDKRNIQWKLWDALLESYKNAA